MANPTVTVDEVIDGVWLVPHRDGEVDKDSRIHVSTDDMGLELPVNGAVFDPPYRDSKIVVISTTYQFDGSINGELHDFENGNVKARQQVARLTNLVKRQKHYRIHLATDDFFFKSIVVFDRCTIKRIKANPHFYEVSIPFVVLDA